MGYGLRKGGMIRRRERNERANLVSKIVSHDRINYDISLSNPSLQMIQTQVHETIRKA